MTVLDRPAPTAAEMLADTTVIICCYTERRLDILRDGIAAVRAQTPAPGELIVVVDNNDSLHATVAAELGGSAAGGSAATRCRVLANAHTPGLSGARNTGAEAASGSILVFLDDDAVPAAGWADALVTPFARADVVGTGGFISPAWPDSAPRWFPPTFLWVVGCSYDGQPGAGETIRNPIGASMGFRRGPLLDAGGFSSDLGRVGTLPVGCEETELAIRVRGAHDGVRIVATDSVVDHSVSSDRTAFRYFVRRCIGEGVSKRQVATLVGRGDAMSSERAYLANAIPRGVAAGFRDAATGDLWGVARAGAIVVGLAAFGVGYVRTMVAANPSSRRRRRS